MISHGIDRHLKIVNFTRHFFIWNVNFKDLVLVFPNIEENLIIGAHCLHYSCVKYPCTSIFNSPHSNINLTKPKIILICLSLYFPMVTMNVQSSYEIIGMKGGKSVELAHFEFMFMPKL